MKREERLRTVGPQTREDFEYLGLVVEVDGAYLTNDGRVIERVWVGRHGTTLKWRVDGRPILYRNFFFAYYEGYAD